ncbi:MAG: c-type cytochrome biogenesis protein CcmI [Azonexus sp.]|nr:c-type cytochrome biogenesis protein CcmI [Azonexus sp.]MCK6411591.1 c-type cytochrome biogenesis protein CcmI [Azonexus sp.]
MTQFALFAALLLAVVLAFLLPPLWLGLRRQPAADRKATNLAIFRDQLAELEREQAEGTLAEADFAQARSELQKRLLEEVDRGEEENQTVSHAPTRKTALVLLIALPLLAVGGYTLLGNPRALDPTQTLAQAKLSPEEIDAMVEKLAAKVAANPDDMQGWLMLARSYKVLGRYQEAIKAYARAEKEVLKEPDLLASYAETIAMAGGNQGLQGKPAELVEKALKIDPKHGHSLFLAGAAAMERGDRKAAIGYWEALLPQVEPGSEIDQMLRSGIDKMKAVQ